MKKHIPEIIYGVCLILKCYSMVSFSELKNSIMPEFREVYINKWIASEVAFEVMSLLVLWYIDYHYDYSNKKRILIILGFILLSLASYIL